MNYLEDRKKPGKKIEVDLEKIDLNLEDLDSGEDQARQEGRKLVVEADPGRPLQDQITINKSDLPQGGHDRRADPVNRPAANFAAPGAGKPGKKTFRTVVLIAIPVLLLLVAAGVYFSLGGGEEQTIGIADPAEELRDKLDLTEQQLQAIQAGTGTVRFSGAQIEIYREPVEVLLEYLSERGELTPGAEETLLRLLDEGEADLQQLNSLAGSILGLEEEPETAMTSQLIKLPDFPVLNYDKIALSTVNRPTAGGKIPGDSAAISRSGPLIGLKNLSVNAAGSGQKFTTVTTLYTPRESKEGDGSYSSQPKEFGRGVGKIGKPNYTVKAVPATGSVFAATTSWIGSDRGTAMVGIIFEVPQDNTAVEITSTVQHASGHIGAGLGINLAGAWIPVAFENDYKPRFETVMNPYTIEKGLEVVVAVLSVPFFPVVKVPIMLKAAKDAVKIIEGSMKITEVARAMNELEGRETTVTTAHVGVLDRGTYQFLVGVKVATSALVTDYVHAAAWGQVQSIEVVQMYYPEPGEEPEPEPVPEPEPEPVPEPKPEPEPEPAPAPEPEPGPDYSKIEEALYAHFSDVGDLHLTPFSAAQKKEHTDYDWQKTNYIYFYEKTGGTTVRVSLGPAHSEFYAYVDLKWVDGRWVYVDGGPL